MALFRRYFGGRAGVELGVHDVIDDHLGVVLLAPLLDEHLVEPLVVGRDKVLPLHDPEGLLALGAGLLRRVNERARESSRAGCLDELSAPEMPGMRVVTHGVLLVDVVAAILRPR